MEGAYNTDRPLSEPDARHAAGGYIHVAMRALHHRYSFAEYVRLSRDSNIKLEFFGGEIFAMAGGTPAHAGLAVNVSFELARQLEGKPCRAFSSDLRIRVLTTGLATYPDLSVICGPLERDPEDRHGVVNPTVLVEILSHSTEDYDRHEKFENYARIPSLQEYVLVSHRERRIEILRRTSTGPWEHDEAGERGTMELKSIHCQLSVERVYAGIELDR